MSDVVGLLLHMMRANLSEQGYTQPAPIRAVVWDGLPGKPQ